MVNSHCHSHRQSRHQGHTGPQTQLTVSFARVVDLGEVLVAGALVRALRVVADVGAQAELLAFIFVWKNIRTRVQLGEDVTKTSIFTRKITAFWNASRKPCPDLESLGTSEAPQPHVTHLKDDVPSQLFLPTFWKPGLQVQKESLPLVTQCASSTHDWAPWWQLFSGVSVGEIKRHWGVSQ